jgi:release factor glutamine methyltransferase
MTPLHGDGYYLPPLNDMKTPDLKTGGDWLKAARQRIDALDARLLLQAVTGCSRADLICHPDTPLSVAAIETLEALLQRRAAGEPLAYLIGETSFRGRRFKVTPAVLTPRPETEELVDAARARLAQLISSDCALPDHDKKIYKLLDLGTGSGVIAISLALECPDAQVTACDISPAALAVAQGNAERLRAQVRFLASDWFSALADARFHLIVANPPYIAADDPHLAGDGLRYEPRLALTDEADGLTAIRAIITAAPAHLEPGGCLLFEHGYNQGEAARQQLAAAGFEQAQTFCDLAGQERISSGVWRQRA